MKLSFCAASQKGFTLIELLIVVAIIAILAAIAVPNFLESQTRAKVSRVRSDMRAIATGLEAYFTDYNSYVNDSDNILGQDGYNGFARLTTPVSYLTALAKDPFQEHLAPKATKETARFYALGSGSDNQGWGNAYGAQTAVNQPRVHSWLIFSVGPDGAAGVKAGDNTSGSHTWPWGTACLIYDPTNGSISMGDLYRAGGALDQGDYKVNGVLRGLFN